MPGSIVLRAGEQAREVILADAEHHRDVGVGRPAREPEHVAHEVIVAERGLDLVEDQHELAAALAVPAGDRRGNRRRGRGVTGRCREVARADRARVGQRVAVGPDRGGRERRGGRVGAAP